MNKKLFSWKALAGLALLVAMGMTSCKNTAEVDPNDPFNVTKPVTPGIVDSKTADLTIAIGVPSDFLKFWNKVDADTKTALAKKSEITVLIKTQGMKLGEKASAATRTLTLPDFFNGKDGKIVNILMDGAFGETKNELIVKSTALAKDLIYFSLPGNNDESIYSLRYNAGTSIPVLMSNAETYIDKLTATGDNDKNALTVSTGIQVARISDVSDAVNIKGGNIVTLMTNVDQTTGFGVKHTTEDETTATVLPGWRTNKEFKNGIELPNGNGDVYGVWATGDIDVYAMSYNAPLTDIVIEEGNTVTLYGPEWGWKGWGASDAAPFVNNIVGLGDNGGNLQVGESWAWPHANKLTNTESVINVTILGDVVVDNDIFENVKFNGYASIDKSLSALTGKDLTFNGGVYVTAPNTDYEFTFNGANFKSGFNIGAGLAGDIAVQAVKDADDQNAYIVTYRYYNFKTKSWQDAAGNYYEVDNYKDIPAQNRSLDKEGGSADNYTPAWQLGGIEAGHTWYVFIEYLSEDVTDYSIVLDFSSCKVDGKAMTNNNLTKVLSTPLSKNAVAAAQNVKYRIGSTLFKWTWTTGGAKLVSTK